MSPPSGTTPPAGRPPLDRAVILAGGRSRRMGRDKALLDLGGETLLTRLVRILSPHCRALGIAAGGGDRAARLAASLPPGDGPAPEFFLDSRPEAGPLEGVRASLEAIREPRALVVAVDLPFPSMPLARLLWSESSRPGRRGAVPRWRRGLEPTFAVYSKGLLDDLERALAAGRRDLEQLAGHDGVVVIDVDEPSTRKRLGGETPFAPEVGFWNINTPEDLEAARRRVEER